MNDAAVVQGDTRLVAFGVHTHSRVAGFPGDTTERLPKWLHQSRSYQQHGSHFSTSSPPFASICLFDFSYPRDTKWYLTMVLIHVSLTANDAENLLMFLGHLYIVFGQLSGQILCPFLNGVFCLLFVVLALSCNSSLCIRDTRGLFLISKSRVIPSGILKLHMISKYSSFCSAGIDPKEYF